MKISHNHKFIFLSNPKCGSSSLRRVLSPYSNMDAATIYGGALPENKEKLTPELINLMHISAYELQDAYSKAENAEHIWDEYYKFGTVRNPWKRMVSWYFFLQPDKNMVTILDRGDKDYDVDSAYTHHFNDFIDHLAKEENEGHRLPNYNFFYTNWHTKEDLVDEVFKLEDIANGETVQDTFKEKTGIDLPRPIPNYSPDFKLEAQSRWVKFKGDPYDLYNDSSKQFVDESFKSDIEKFNYEFGQ